MRIFEAMKQLDIVPSKRFSQNFLTDPNIPKKIVQKAGVQEGDLIFEVGPGLGSLTEALIDAKATVFAIEKDRRFISYLREQFPTLILFEGDFLHFPLETLQVQSGKKFKVVANLPYNITAPILTKLVPRNDLFCSITAMIQEEVALRIIAQPKTPEIGALTYFINYYGRSKILFRVSPQAFFPIPKVSSAVIQINLNPPPPCRSEEELFMIIRRSYQQRRKMLRSSLKSLYPPKKIEEALEKIAFLPTSRPEDLSLQDFIQFSSKLHD